MAEDSAHPVEPLAFAESDTPQAQALQGITSKPKPSKRDRDDDGESQPSVPDVPRSKKHETAGARARQGEPKRRPFVFRPLKRSSTADASGDAGPARKKIKTTPTSPRRLTQRTNVNGGDKIDVPAKTKKSRAKSPQPKGKGKAAVEATTELMAVAEGRLTLTEAKSKEKDSAPKKRGSFMSILRKRAAEARKRSWVIMTYDESKLSTPFNINLIGFFSAGDLYGGPVRCLSNFFLCKIYDPDVHETHIFNCFEQYYQYLKLKMIAKAPPVNNDWAPPVPSDEMKHVVLLLTNPNDIAAAGRSYNKYGKAHKDWEVLWKRPWELNIHYIMKRGIYLKFEQNKPLREILLKTGDHELVEAAKFDSNCGIGFRADEMEYAVQHREKWGNNLLGTMLTWARNYFRKLDGHDGKFDHEYFDNAEREYVAREEANKIKTAERKAQQAAMKEEVKMLREKTMALKVAAGPPKVCNQL